MGQQFGKYSLLNRIATGGMAEIFLAKQVGPEGFEKVVVIKKILPHLTDSPEFTQMFLDEARIAAQLNHGNIVQIYDLGKVGDTYFIAMEFVDGRDIPTIVRHAEALGKTLPLEAAVRIACGACEGLYYAHAKTDNIGRPLNIVHRDISPQNILVTYEGVVKVVDFGIAQASTRYAKTRTGILKGKYAYMSPEQVLGLAVDGRSDQFSLGTILYELTTGTRLFHHPSELMILKHITEGVVKPPSKVVPDYPTDLEAIVLRALARNPRERFEDMRQMGMALEAFLARSGKPFNHYDLSAFLKALFSDRFAERTRAIEAGAQAEEVFAKEVAGSAPKKAPSEVSAVDSTAFVQRRDVSHASAVGARPGTNRKWLLGGIAAMVVVGGVGVFFATKGGSGDQLADSPRSFAVSPALPAPAAPAPAPTPAPALAPAPAPPPATATASATATAPATATATSQSTRTEAPPSKRASAPSTTPSPPSASARTSASERRRGRTPRAVARVEPAAARADQPQPRPSLPSTGRLSIDVVPQCEVVVGERRLGETPLSDVELPAGRHSLKLRNSAEGFSRSVSVEIEAGKATNRSFNFSKGTVAFAVEPWADVYQGSKNLGQTPIEPIQLWAGKYTFLLVNDELNQKRRVSVEVRPGQKSIVKEKLD